MTEATSERSASEFLAKELRECLVRLPEDRTRWARRLGELLEEGSQRFVQQAVEIVDQHSVPPESEKALLSLLIDQGYLLPVLLGVYSTDRIRFREVLLAVQAVEPRLHTRITKRLTELLDHGHPDRAEESSARALILKAAVGRYRE